MAEVIPFRGIFYNRALVDSSSIVAPPYDIVTPAFKEALYARSPYNIIRVDFGRDMSGDNERKNRYTRAKKLFNQWLKKGILINDTKPSFYCYAIDYRINEEEKRLIGLLGVVKLEDLGKGCIHPHEMTYSKPMADRLSILRFLKANISPIFSFYSSKEAYTSSILEKTIKGKALISARDEDGFVHKLWRISDKRSIETIKKELSDNDIFIADGHHRYETALQFRDEMAKVNSKLPKKSQDFLGWDYVMMFLANMEDNGLTILPAHRLIKYSSKIQGSSIVQKVKAYFEVMPVENISMLFKMMKNRRHTLGMVIKGEKPLYLLRFKGAYSAVDSHQNLKRLDVTILHKLIIERLLCANKVEYEMDPQSAIEKVNKGMYHVGFFLNPTRIEEVRRVALSGQRMPPKSTYFYPKLLTGMVIYKF